MSEAILEKKFTLAAKLIADLMIENGLSDWTIKTNSKRTALAETYHNRKEIRFSKYFLMIANKDQLTGVTLHEVTHAVLGKGYGHGEVFEKKCKEISPNGDYSKRAVSDVSIHRYIITCPECGQSGGENQVRERYCGKCFNKNKSKVAFVSKENKMEVVLW